MADRPLSISTQVATPNQTAFASSSAVSDALSAGEPAAEDDNYTIKCICNWSEDDGNTIYCETCNTWQHIECFYPGRADETSHPDFVHSCADCKPRPLDRQRAIEWQRSIQNKAPSDHGDKKIKRPSTSKSHKKKTKPSDLQVNGSHEHDVHRNGSPQDHHPHTKKSKGHRSTQSVSSQLKRSPTRRNSTTHPPSPAHTPPDLPKGFEVHSFSESFEKLYANNTLFALNDCNTFQLQVANTMTLWLHDIGKLRGDTGIKNEQDAFQRIKPVAQSLTFPETWIDRKDVMVNGMSRRFCSLVITMPVNPSCAIGELNGLVGFQKDYCNDPSNRWQDFVHPKPFVFFPPHLPLYIDARNEGSNCRYARRSCQPNAIVETMVAHGREYHFWLISEHQLSPGERITLPWDFRFPPQLQSRFLHLLNLGGPDGAPSDGADITDEEYEQLTNVTHLVLSEYGGCACELGNECAFARFHRNYHGRLHNQSNGVKAKKGRKSKQNHVSPTSTGPATNSRAASEGQQDQCDDDDNRSVSGSLRSKPHSRDLTPLHGVGETNGILTEPSDREKRKLAMLEDSFRKMEQGQPLRKKKRTSEGSTMSGPASTTPHPPSKPRQRSVAPRGPVSQVANTNGSRANRQHADASKSRRDSDSPFNAGSPTGLSPGNSASRSASMPSNMPRQTKGLSAPAIPQNDDVEKEWYDKPHTRHARRIKPYSVRVLENRIRLASVWASAGRVHQSSNLSPTVLAPTVSAPMVSAPTVSAPTMPKDRDRLGHDDGPSPESPTDARGGKTSIASPTHSVDISPVTNTTNMTEAPAIKVGNTMKPAPPTWPGTSIADPRINSKVGPKSPNLRVQMPPAVSASGVVSGNGTPSFSAGSVVQSPLFNMAFSKANQPRPPSSVNGAVQSPAKGPKKSISLSAYTAKQNSKAQAKIKKEESASKNPSSGGSPTIAPAVLQPSLSTPDEAKASGTLEGSAIVDTPTTEKALDPIASSAGPSEPAAKN